MNYPRFLSVTAAVLLWHPAFVCAQESTSSKPLAAPASGFDLSGIYAQMLDGILTELAKPETAQKLAKFQKQHYDALCNAGFTNEDALKIVIATQAPLVPTSK